MIKITITTLVLLFTALTAGAQMNNDKLKNESWVRIMHDDTTVNYFQAKKDFAQYLTKHRRELPAQESKEKASPEPNGGPHEAHLEDPADMYISAYQKWARSVRPFVTKDGKVPPPSQRIKTASRAK